MRLISIVAPVLSLVLILGVARAMADETVDPEAQANQNLGAQTTPPPAAAQPPADHPDYVPRATPVAKDLQPDDVVVEEIHTQSTPSADGAKKHANRPAAEESDGSARDTETEAQGSAPIGGAPERDESLDNAATADQMTMKIRPAKEAVEATPTPSKKPKREQKIATKTTAVKTVKPSAKKTAKAETVAVATKPESAPKTETVLKWLENGNTRFVKKHFRADGRSPADRARLEKGEHPHVAFLAAPDSRVTPEIIFDQVLGEVYDVRTFGENLDSSTIAALEYAVSKLKVPLIVVMGNSDCAAVKTMLEDKVNENGDHVGDGISSPDIEKVIADIKPRLKTLKDDPVSPGYEVEATLNADGVARELVKRSDIIREAVEKNELVIKSALYRLSTGKVSFY